MKASSPTKPAILVVEDEVLIAKQIEEVLAALHCTTLGPVTRLDQVYEILERSRPDAALLDVRLSDDEEIYPAADELRRRNIPFAFLTAYRAQDLQSGYRTEIVLAKPFSNDELIDFVRSRFVPGM